jgi:23S rRNA pseudouridine1911/1915/1917 synthase
MERGYAALVEGVPSADEGQVDAPIYDVYEAGRRRLARPGEPAHEARTRWRVVERFRAGALLEVELETGRQHQIRLHLAHLGLPIVGDDVYGRSARRTIVAPRHMLHARHLAFVHPISGARVEAESPLPADFRKALAALRCAAAGSARRGR